MDSICGKTYEDRSAIDGQQTREALQLRLKSTGLGALPGGPCGTP